MYAEKRTYVIRIGWCLLWAVFCCPITHAAEKTPATVERAPVPDAKALKEARASARELVGPGTEFAKDPEFAVDKLLRTGKAEKNDPVGKYACFERALKIATDAKSPPMVLAVAGKIAEHFDVSPVKSKGDALAALSRKARDKSLAPAMAKAYEELLAEAIDADEFDQAGKAILGAKRFAARTKNSIMLNRLRSTQNRLLSMKRASAAVAKANETLKTSPDDPDANETVGQYYCFIKNNWQRGLPMLAKSSDELLMRAARGELAKPATPEAVLAVGDAWWNLSSKHRDKIATASLKMHAGACYDQVIDKLIGLKKVKYEKRILDSGIMGAQGGRFSATAAAAAIAKLRSHNSLVLYLNFERKTMQKKKGAPVVVNLAEIKRACEMKGKPEIVKGKVGDALEFDGKESYMKLNYKFIYDRSKKNDWDQITVMVWAKWVGKKSGNLLLLALGGRRYGFRLDTEERGWIGRVPGKEMAWKKGSDKSSSSRPRPNRWYHLAATYDGKISRFYVNGKEVNSRAITGFTWKPWMGFIAGAGKPGALFDGVVDEAYVFTHALAATEIESYYRATAGK
jgi:hypothetical protein